MGEDSEEPTEDTGTDGANSDATGDGSRSDDATDTDGDGSRSDDATDTDGDGPSGEDGTGITDYGLSPGSGAETGADGRQVDDGRAAAGQPAGGPAGESGETSAAAPSRGVTLDGTDEAVGQAYGTRPRADEDEDEDEALGSTYGGRRRERNPEAAFQRSEPERSGLTDLSRADLREHYGPLRTLFKRREASYRSFQRQLMQARVRTTYDRYLAQVVSRMLLLAVLGVVVGVVAAGGVLWAAETGRLPRVLRGPGLPVGTLAGAAAGVSVAAGVVSAGAYWTWHRVLKLRRTVARRRREIAYNLPYAVTFMYALSQAGVGFDRIVARLADSRGSYGAVSEEFDRVVRDVEMFGNNLYTGMENLRAVTPSEELRRLVDDMLTVLETGGDLSAFLRDEVDQQLETALAAQEAYVERLELLSEVFVVGFVAAPLFVLVVLIVISFLGAATLGVIATVVYAVIPLALAGFVVLIDALGAPFRARRVSFEGSRGPAEPDTEEEPAWGAAYRRSRELSGLRTRFRDQVVRTRDEPWRALLFSVPLAVAVPIAGVLTGSVPLGLEPLLDRPVEITFEAAVAPLVIAFTPVAAVHEYRQAQERALQERFPDLLELLASSNRRGLPLRRGLDIVAESSSGRLGEELRLLRNDVLWNADVPGAFRSFGERLVSPALSRTAHLVAEGSRATSDLHVVLSVAATDTAERARLRRRRRQNLQSYLVIVVIGFLVYLLVMLLLAANFLDPIEALTAGERVAEEGPVSLGAVPVDRLRLLLFHSALIQGFGSGVLAGKLAEDSLYSGLKYGIALAVLAVVAFTFV